MTGALPKVPTSSEGQEATLGRRPDCHGGGGWVPGGLGGVEVAVGSGADACAPVRHSTTGAYPGGARPDRVRHSVYKGVSGVALDVL